MCATQSLKKTILHPARSTAEVTKFSQVIAGIQCSFCRRQPLLLFWTILRGDSRMTDEQMERKMEFIVETFARIAANDERHELR